MKPIDSLYDRLRHEYLAMTATSNPTKIAVDLERDGDMLGVYGNVMPAMTTDGLFGTKIIRVDERTGGMTARTIVFDRDGSVVANVDSVQLTRERCGLMAALAVDLFFGRKVAGGLRYGLVGTGRTNLATARILQSLFGVSGEQFSLKASPRNPTKNAHLFPAGAVLVERARALADCDVVIECTTIRDRAEVLEIDDFVGEGGDAPLLFVAQDGGWQLGASFRSALPSFCDHLGQMNAHPTGDYDWPWDSEPVVIGRDMRSPDFRDAAQPGGAAVYLSGIAIADIVIAAGSAAGRSICENA
ncbi:hypothetical protein [Azospirillum sp. Sh1]|uniref:hypothetical protein n=1 Tax=Azospirillum sp. Sh1 TaxID=2607285 RepID=UPI0011ED6771|nr:hypothetical protein [Azospirillum sp. Sh1]KAA0573389.1 hypothetical protein FZ029_20645 [Azospirillum sp. Sh1]